MPASVKPNRPNQKPVLNQRVDEVAKLTRPAPSLSSLRLIGSILATMSAHAPPARLDEAEYSRLAAALMAGVEATLDAWLQTDVIDIDSARTGGLLEMSFPGGSKIILNTQPPLQEIWLAAKSGGFHFRHQNGRWVDTKDACDFYDTLSRCATEQAGRSLRFRAD